MRIDVSIIESSITIWINDSQRYKGSFTPSEGDIRSLRFNATSTTLTSNRVALDNFRFTANPTVIPEGPARLELDAGSLDFGDVRIDRNKELALTATNLGAETLILSNFTIPNGFDGSLGTLTLQPLESKAIPISFSPDAIGSVSGNLTFDSNEDGQPAYSIPLTGRGTGLPQAALPIDPITLTALAGTEVSQAITLTNSGAGSMDWSVVFRERGSSNASSFDWIVADPASGTLTAGANTTLSVNIDTTDLPAADYELDWVIQTDDPVNPEFTIPVTLTVQPNPKIRLSAELLDFGSQFVGSTTSLPLTLHNVGTSELTISSVSASESEFTTSFSGSLSIPAGNSAVIDVLFTPASLGSSNANLSIASNDNAEPTVSLQLLGTGASAPEISIDPEVVNFTTAFGTSPEPQTLAISNPGGFELTVGLRIEPTVESEVLGFTPVYQGHDEYTLSKADAEAVLADQTDVATQASGLMASASSSGEPPALDDVLAALTDVTAITDLVPNLYPFSHGVTGYYISDGGNDMFDSGNRLHFGSQSELVYYSDRSIQTYPSVNPQVNYFTQKDTGLFVMAADIDNIDRFAISGGLGADGLGAVEAVTLETTINGTRFTGFFKRVHSVTEPSVNQLIMFRSNGNAFHTIPISTNDGGQTVTGLTGVDRVYYLLFASANGGIIDNATAIDIMETFLMQIEEGSWLELSHEALTVAPGGSANVELRANAAQLESGDYSFDLILDSNDPQNPSAVVPVNLSVGPEPVSLNTQEAKLSGIVGLPIQPYSLELNPAAATSGDSWEIVENIEWLELDQNTGSLPATVQLSVAEGWTTPGSYADAIQIRCNGAVQTLEVKLNLAEMDPYFLEANVHDQKVYSLVTPTTASAPSLLLQLDDTTGEILNYTELVPDVSDLAFTKDGQYIFAFSGPQSLIAKVSTSDLEILSTRTVGGLYASGSSYQQNYSIEQQQGDQLLLTDGHSRPYLSSFDYSDLSTANVVRFPNLDSMGRFKLDGTGQHLYGYRSYYSSRGILMAGTLVDGQLIIQRHGTDISGMPAGSPFLMSPSGDWIAYDKYVYKDKEFTNRLAVFPERILAASHYGDIALSEQAIFDGATGASLHSFSESSTYRTVNAAQTKVISFNASTQTFAVLDLAAIQPLPGIGINLIPSDGGAVLSGGQLSWTPDETQNDDVYYLVYAGTSLDAVANASFGSPEFLGIFSDTEADMPDSFTPGAQYFWRVDAVSGSEITTGTPHSFYLADLALSPELLKMATVSRAQTDKARIQLSTTNESTQWTLESDSERLSFSQESGTGSAEVTITVDTTDLSNGEHYLTYRVGTNGHWFDQFIYLEIVHPGFERVITDPLRNKIYLLHKRTPKALLLEVDTASEAIVDSISLGDIDLAYDADSLWQNLYFASFSEAKIQRIDLERFEIADSYGAGFSARPLSLTAFNDERVLLCYGTSNPILELRDLKTPQLPQVLGNQSFYRLHLSKDEKQLWAVRYLGSSIYMTERYSLSDQAVITLEVDSGQHASPSPHELQLNDSESELFVGRGVYLDAQTLEYFPYGLSDVLYSFTSKPGIGVWNYGIANIETGQRVLNTYLTKLTTDETIGVRAYTSTLTFTDIPATLQLQGRAVRPLLPDAGIIYEVVDALKWSPDPVGYSYHVYWGDTEAAVQAADTSSPLYRGYHETESLTLDQPVPRGSERFWRVDVVRGDEVLRGDVWSFSTTSFALSQGQISEQMLQLEQAMDRTIQLDCAAESAWTISIPESAQSWISASETSGTGSASLEFTLNPDGLDLGTHRASIILSIDGGQYSIPVELVLQEVQLSKLIEHPNQDSLIGYSGVSGGLFHYLVLIDPASLRITQKLKHARHVTDLHYDRHDNRILLAQLGTADILEWNPESNTTSHAFRIGVSSTPQFEVIANNRALAKEGSYLAYRDLGSGTEFQPKQYLGHYGRFVLSPDQQRLVFTYYSSSNSLRVFDYANGTFASTWSNSQVSYPRTAPLHAGHTGEIYLYGNLLDQDGTVLQSTLPNNFSAISMDATLAAANDGLYAIATSERVETISNLELPLFSEDGNYFYCYQDATGTPKLLKYRLDAGELAVTPTSILFPDTFEHGTATRSVQLSNLGFQAVTISSITVEGDAFALSSEPVPTAVLPRETRTLELSFTPTSTERLSGELVIQSNDPNNPTVRVPLSGRGILGPIATIDTTELSANLRSQQSVDLSFTLSNTGAKHLTYAVSDNASWIAMSLDSGSLAPDTSKTFTVPVHAGALSDGTHQGTIQISTNDPLRRSITVTVTLNVTGIPVIELTHSPLDFGRALIGSDPVRKPITIRNRGVRTLIVNSTVSSGQPNYNGDQSRIELGAGGSATLMLTFAPVDTGDIIGNLRLNTNDPLNSVIDLPLTGYGAEQPDIDVVPSALSFTLNAGDVGSKSLTISNLASPFSQLDYTMVIRDPSIAASSVILPAAQVPVDLSYNQLVDVPAVASLSESAPSPASMADATLFMVGSSSTDIQEINPINGSVIRTIPLLDSVSRGPDGLAYDGQYLYFTNNFGQRTIYQIHAGTGAVIDTLSVSSMNIDGLAHDGEYLYALDYSSNTIAVIEMGIGVVRTITPTVSLGGGITAGGSRGTLFVGNFSGNIVEIDSQTGEVLSTITNSTTVYGIAYSEAAGVLLLAEKAQNRIRKVNPDTKVTLGYLYTNGFASGLAADEAGSGNRNWLSINQTQGSIIGGESDQVMATADATFLNAGSYQKEILIQSSDPDEAEWIIPVELTVIGAPGIELQTDTVDFGTLYVGSSSYRQLGIRNVGTDTLTIQAIGGLGTELEVQNVDLPFSIAPGGSFNLDLSLTPASAREISGSIQIESNDQSDASVTVSYSAIALNPPVVEVDHARFDFELSPGGTQSKQLAIRNTGGSQLDWGLSFGAGAEAPSTSTQSLQQAPEPDLTAESAPGSLIVRFKPAVTDSEQDELITALGAALNYRSSLVNGLVVLQLPESMSVAATLSALSADDRVLYAEPDYIIRLDQEASNTPVNDPRFDELWGLKNSGQSGGLVDADIDADEAWILETGSQQVLVGVIDTGVDYTHPDLVSNVWVNTDEIADNGVDDDGNGYVDDIYGWDFAYNDNDPMDVHGHGTHVAGTIGATANNNIGIVGVAQHCQIVAIKFLNDSGSGQTSNAIKCVDYAVTVGVDLTNNSWGGGSFSTGLRDAIAAAGAAGQLFVAAAGNSSANADLSPHYPSSYSVDSIVSVAATDRSDKLASYSNYGANSVDIGAPGSAILSTLPNARYGSKNGTSMAAPHVAGAVAILRAYSPTSSALEIKQALMDSADQISSLSGRCLSEGRLNLRAAIEHVIPPWVSFSTTSGSIDAAANQQLTVTVDSTGLKKGRYAGNLILNSNDPSTPVLYIPIMLHLAEASEHGLRYMAWAHSQLDSMQAEDETDYWGPLADADRDGRQNLLEFFLNSDPEAAGNAQPRMEIDGEYFIWTTEVDPSALTLDHSFQVNHSLNDPQSEWASQGVLSRNYEADGRYYLEYKVPMNGNPTCFGRLSVAIPASE